MTADHKGTDGREGTGGDGVSGQGVQDPEARGTGLRQPVDAEIRRIARALVREARDGTLAVNRPADGHPFASRVLLTSDFRGCPIITVSALSPHTEALRGDPRCSLLVARSGKGDPLAHPRATLLARAEFIDAAAAERTALRERFLARHRKAALYIDFADFSFVRLEPHEAWLVGGFGKASVLERSDLVDEAAPELEATEARARDHMNADHADFIRKLAAARGLEENDWRIATMDRFGFEIAAGDRLARIEFHEDAAASGYRQALVAMAQ